MAFKRKRMAVDPNVGRDPELPKLNPYLARGAETRVDGKFDTSQLRHSIHRDLVHRDYAAHWFRWGFTSRFCKRGMRVLDVGCGQDQMMARCLRRMLSSVPKIYVGVDLNRIAKPLGYAWTKILDEFNFLERWRELEAFGPYDIIANFEVIEHMPKAEGKQLLQAMRKLLAPAGRLVLSTPVYNGNHMAANHVHEYRFDELLDELKRAGLEVDNVYGTFMTSQAIKRVATKEEVALVKQLSGWYSWDVLANFLAPKYPEHSSNCAWVCRRKS